jgi:hypothetical protein
MTDQCSTSPVQLHTNICKEYSQNLIVNNSSDRELIIEKQQEGRVFNRERVNLESHQLVWCNINVNITTNAEPIATLEDLRKIVDYTKLFNSVEECQQHLTQTTDSVTFLVCSDELGKKMIPEIYQLNNISSIYIYCRDINYHNGWFSNFTKVRVLVDPRFQKDSQWFQRV